VTDFVRPARAVPLRLVSGRGHYDSIVQSVMSAETSVWIATANLKELMVEDARARPGVARNLRRPPAYRSILAVFDELAKKGVELRILHAAPPSQPFRKEIARHPRLRKGGLELRLCPRVHFKAVVVDGSLLYLGSANWTGAGLGAKGSGRRNFELGLLTSDLQLLDEIQGLYDTIWRGGQCKACKRRDLCPAPLDGIISPPGR
jgi:phosphatidylserine/phosphatidylglycerophosphate/cardiolipin synthase-like enzyme